MFLRTHCIRAWLEVITAASTGSPVLDLGDDTDPNRYVAARQVLAAVAHEINTATGSVQCKLITIDLIANTATFDR